MSVTQDNTEQAERNLALLDDRLAGVSWAELAERSGVSVERVKQVVKREARKRGVRLPPVSARAAKVGVQNVEFEWIECLVAWEKALRAATSAKKDQPAYLAIEDDGEDRSEMYRWVTGVLTDRGWRVGVDDHGDTVWYAPGPLSDPGRVQANQN